MPDRAAFLWCPTVSHGMLPLVLWGRLGQTGSTHQEDGGLEEMPPGWVL